MSFTFSRGTSGLTRILTVWSPVPAFPLFPSLISEETTECAVSGGAAILDPRDGESLSPVSCSLNLPVTVAVVISDRCNVSSAGLSM